MRITEEPTSVGPRNQNQVGEPGPQRVALLVEHQEELAAEAVVSKDGEVAGRVE